MVGVGETVCVGVRVGGSGVCVAVRVGVFVGIVVSVGVVVTTCVMVGSSVGVSVTGVTGAGGTGIICHPEHRNKNAASSVAMAKHTSDKTNKGLRLFT